MAELWAVVLDVLAYGDFRGHWRAWRAVRRGDVTPETRAGLPAAWAPRVEVCGREMHTTGKGVQASEA
jgi:hypothetical protein